MGFQLKLDREEVETREVTDFPSGWNHA